MRYLYTILLYFATPLILVRLLLRSKKNPAYRARIKERFAYIPMINKKKSIWVHAVSLGEAIAATPLIRELIQQYPDQTIVVTTTTPTGSQQIQKQFGQKVYHVYTPYDLPTVIRRFLKRTRPIKAIIMETELWPNMLYELKRANIPVMIANARLSERSYAKYQRFSHFFKPFLQTITVIAAQSPADGNRFKKLGATQNVIITGNIKFDTNIPDGLCQRAQELKSHWQSRPTFIAASTHQGEEQIVLNAFKNILIQFPNALLILVPRHPERFLPVAKLCSDTGYHLAYRSKNEFPNGDTQIYFGDTMGDLTLLYAASDVAFVGGSFAPIGGHNLIEPASLSVPIISGPHLENFLAIRDLLQEANALILVKDAEQLAEQVIKLFSDKNMSHLYGARALSVSDQNRGAIEKHLDLIKQSI